MRIDAQYDDRMLQARFNRTAKNLAYSTQQALNDTMLEIQTAERVGLDRAGLHIRKAGFLYRLIKVFTWAKATQGRAYAEIGIDSSKKNVFLGLLETGGEKEPVAGKHVAVPITGEAARPSMSQLVPDSLRFLALKLRRKGLVYEGRQGTYLVPGVGIFQRAAGQKVAALIYTLKYARVPIRRKLHFFEIARDTFDRVFRVKFLERFNRQVR